MSSSVDSHWTQSNKGLKYCQLLSLCCCFWENGVWWSQRSFKSPFSSSSLPPIFFPSIYLFHQHKISLETAFFYLVLSTTVLEVQMQIPRLSFILAEHLHWQQTWDSNGDPCRIPWQFLGAPVGGFVCVRPRRPFAGKIQVTLVNEQRYWQQQQEGLKLHALRSRHVAGGLGLSLRSGLVLIHTNNLATYRNVRYWIELITVGEGAALGQLTENEEKFKANS